MLSVHVSTAVFVYAFQTFAYVICFVLFSLLFSLANNEVTSFPLCCYQTWKCKQSKEVYVFFTWLHLLWPVQFLIRFLVFKICFTISLKEKLKRITVRFMKLKSGSFNLFNYAWSDSPWSEHFKQIVISFTKSMIIRIPVDNPVFIPIETFLIRFIVLITADNSERVVSNGKCKVSKLHLIYYT